MNKNILILTLLVCFALHAYGQLDTRYNQYMFNPFLYNAAIAGSKPGVNAVISYRTQWLGFSGAPNNQTINVHGAFNGNMGAGLNLIRDEFGPTSNIGIKLSYSYRVFLADGYWSFGLRPGVYNSKYNWAAVEYKNKIETRANANATNLWEPTFDFGTRFVSSGFYMGIAANNLLGNANTFQIENDSLSNVFKRFRQISGDFGKSIKVNNLWVLKPSIFFIYNLNNAYSAEVNIGALYQNQIWFGIAYRSTNSVSTIIEYNLNKSIRFGYSFGIGLSSYIDLTSTYHEVFFAIDLLNNKGISDSPRPN